MKNESDLCEFYISLVGGSASGKTSFISGVVQLMVSQGLSVGKAGEENYIYFRPVAVGSGEISSQPEPVRAAAQAVPMISSPFAMSQGGGGGAFSAAPGKPSSFRDAAQVPSLDISDMEGADKLGTAQQVERLIRQWQIMSAETAGEKKGGFHAPTDKVNFAEMTFEVIVNDEPRARLRITDYGGEFIDDPDGTVSNVYSKLINHIYNSDGAIILANVRAMEEHIDDTFDANTSMFRAVGVNRSISADSINALFRGMGEKDDFTVVAALTQTDNPYIDKRLRENNFRRPLMELKKNILFPTFQCAAVRKWSSGLLPVTAVGTKRDGSANVDKLNNLMDDAVISPHGIDTAVLFCLYNASLARKKALNKERDSLCGMFARPKLFAGKTEKERFSQLSGQLEDMSAIIDALRSDPQLFSEVFEGEFALEKTSDVGEVKVKKQK